MLNIAFGKIWKIEVVIKGGTAHDGVMMKACFYLFSASQNLISEKFQRICKTLKENEQIQAMKINSDR